jgi:outer membrane protein TolC
MAEAQEYLSGFKKQVSFKVQEAYLAVEETKKNLELSEKALKTAEEGKRLVKSRYENSLAPIVDLLDTQLYLDRARADYVARENEYQLAIIKLCYESGTILNELKIE